MSKFDITTLDFTEFSELDKEEQIKYLHLAYMFIDNLSLVKSNVFLKSTFTGSNRLNEILKKNKWYLKFPNARQKSIKFGSAWVMAYKSPLTKDLNLRLLNMITCQYIDDKLIYFSGTNRDIYPDTNKVYDYFYYRLENNKVIMCTGLLSYQITEWVIEVNPQNEFILDTDEIPVWLLPNNENLESSFKNKQYLINLCIKLLFKTEDDIDLGTNKFLLNIRGVPTGKAFIETLKQYKKILKKSNIVTDQMLMINPNSSNPLDRMYGSLQIEQLLYGLRQVLGLLNQQLLISSSSTNKTSNQKNDTEVEQEREQIDNDNKKNKYIWEQSLEEMAYGILKFDNNILFNKNDLTQEIKCNITINKSQQENNKNHNENGKLNE